MRKKIPVIVIMILFVWGCAKKAIPVATTVVTPPENIIPVADTIASAAILEAGKNIYNAKCGACHDLIKPDEYTADKWPAYIHWMAPKARLTEEEKKNVMAYVLANAKG